MDEAENKDSKNNIVLWLLVVITIALVWVFFRSNEQDTNARVFETTPVEFLDHDDLLIDFRDDASDAEIEAFAEEFGISLKPVSNESLDERFYRAHLVDGQKSWNLAKEMMAAAPDFVEVAEADMLISLSPMSVATDGSEEVLRSGFPNDPKYKYQWHMDQIHMRDAWKLSDGKGVTVAVLDTGVAYEDHANFHLVEDLAGVPMVKPYDFVDNDKHANDDHGHGTHVAGTIAQATNNGKGVAGVARAVKIMPLKVLAGNGSGSVAGIADAIRYAADEGAQVINMSLGSRFGSKVLERAVNYAHSKGVTVICAAGNDGRGKVGFPAAYDSAVAVAATQYDERTTFYSNWGSALDIAAPGGNTRVDQNKDGMPDGVLQNTITVRDPTKSDYYGFMGTSMASPHAAGVAALVVAEGVTNPDSVEQVLESTARAPSTGDLDKARYGAGIIDAKAAILAARGKTGAWQFGLGCVLFAASLLGIRRRIPLSWGAFVGMVLGSGGLFFMPYLVSFGIPDVELLSRGLPAIGLTWGMPSNILFYSGLVPLLLVLLLGGVFRLRGILAGLCVGVAAHLVFHATAGITDVEWMGFDSLWLAGNALFCVVLARSLIRK